MGRLYFSINSMNPEELIAKYYSEQPELQALLLRHSRDVANMALQIADMHPEMQIDRQFVYEAAMLHDIGILYTNATDIHCHGNAPYIQHGILGAELLRKEGYPKHARVAERHTGAGLTARMIRTQLLPLPEEDFTPETLEEKLVCYADKFFSKSSPDIRKSLPKILKSLSRFELQSPRQFIEWKNLFGIPNTASEM